MKEFDIVQLKEKYQEINPGTMGTIVLEYDGTAFEVEFFNENFDTIAVLTIPAEFLELVRSYQ